MNRFLTRKNVLIAVSSVGVILALIIGYGLVREYALKRTVTFNFSAPVQSIGISALISTDCLEDCEIPLSTVTLDKPDTARLADGAYYVIPKGDDIATDPIRIEVSQNTVTFTVNPGLSDTYLNQLLEKDVTQIHEAIVSAYPIAKEYTINRGALYGNGDWYATSLIRSNQEAGSSSDVYHVIVQKVSGKWQVVTKPDIHFTYKQFPDIPRAVLNDANVGVTESE